MNPELRERLEPALHLYPHALERAFPRLVARIARAWDTPAEALEVFDDLLIDRRGNRQGFPPEVAREIFQLSVAYEALRKPRRDADDVWQHERAAATLVELGMRLAPPDMLRSAEGGDISRLALFLAAGMPVDTTDARAWTPLMVAAFHGNEPAAKLLIEHGANPAARDRAGYTPLHWAAFQGYDAVAALILKRGVDCDVQSNAGLTPLLQASANGHEDVVDLLLAAGADAGIATHDGWTPLHKAVANGHQTIVGLLLDAGASAFAPHAQGATPISLAARRSDGMSRLLRAAA